MKFLSIVVVTVGFVSLMIGQEPPLAMGQKAPDFTLPYATRDSVFQSPLKLSEIIGQHYIILAFYPGDWSSGCTKEMCAMRDDFSNLQKLNAEILGISGDYKWSHHEWAKYHNLTFKLVSDHLHQVARTYNSYDETRLYNKRTVFVIDKVGTIAYIDLEYSVRDDQSFIKLKDALARLQ